MKNDKLIRKGSIDGRLLKAGWNVSDRTHVIAEFDIIANPNLVKEAATPTLIIQTKFAQIIEKAEVLKTQYQQIVQELENLYGSLRQKTFSKELSVKIRIIS